MDITYQYVQRNVHWCASENVDVHKDQLSNKISFCTGLHTSNEFDVHQNVDSNVHQVVGLTNELLSGENKLLLEAYPMEKLLLVLQ